MSTLRGLLGSGLFLMLIGCGSLIQFSPKPELDLIAQDLAYAISQQYQVNGTALYIGEVTQDGKPQSRWQDRLDNALRELGFEIHPQPQHAVHVEGTVTYWDNGQVHVGLSLDDDWQLERLYRIDGGQPYAASAFTLGQRQPEASEPLQMSAWDLHSVATSASTHPDESESHEQAISTSESDKEPETQAIDTLMAHELDLTQTATDVPFMPTETELDRFDADVPSVVSSTTCLFSDLQPGSLQANLQRILRQCGWQLRQWPQVADDSTQVTDWIISQPISLDTFSLDDLLHSLQTAYGLSFVKDVRSRSIDFSWNPSS